MAARRPHSKGLRKGRHSQAGQFYFLTTCIADRRPIFVDSIRARIVLDSLRWLTYVNRFATDAAVVMPDHVHFAGALGNDTLAGIMHSFKSYTANRLVMTSLRAPVWQNGYHDHGLRDDEDYRSRVRYLLDDPVRAGLVERTADYPHLILPASWSADDTAFR